jgi:type I restriction enzyme R subunit
MKYTEDKLVQETTANYLRDQLGWDSIYAYNNETFGPQSTLGRNNETETVLARALGQALRKLNPGLPAEAYDAAVRDIAERIAAQSPLQTNRDKYELMRNGVVVPFRDGNGVAKKQRLRIFDFDNPENNNFLAVRELWIKGALYRRRADVIGFVNGVPLVFMELKNIHRDLRRAYEENLADYRDTIPHLFDHNALIVLGNGIAAKYGSISSRYKHFREWKRLEEDAPGIVDMETLLKGLLSKHTFMDIFENFILFDESPGRLQKIIAQNQQVLGVNRAIASVRERKEREGKLGVFWHTQGSGKSYSIVFFTQKVHRKIGANFTFLVLTDRDDLDKQIYGTFAGCGVIDNQKEPCRAGSGEQLKAFLTDHHKGYIFSLIQKFNQKVAPDAPYSTRDDIIVITDEAHRTQYGELALNVRNALPNAARIGFTGTPLFKDDQITKRVFGDYVSRYDFQRAVEDEATVPLYYDARGERLGVALNDLNERIADKLEEIEARGDIEDIDIAQRLEQELKRDYHVITAATRLDNIARDFVTHYSTAWENGKAMFVCIDKVTTVRMFDFVAKHWQERIAALEKELATVADEQEIASRKRQLAWMRETRMAVVVSEEQGEVERFRKWNVDIGPHRKLMKEGFVGADGKRLNVEDAFKSDDHPFRVVFVCAMWLTGFDVPSLATLYLDKPLRAHTLMQAIARANRVHEGKNNGLIVDYCGILKSLRSALATFAGGGDAAGGQNLGGPTDPVRPEEELLDELREAIAIVREFISAQGGDIDAIIDATGFARIAAIEAAKNAINENDETRKRFEIMARAVFIKFKACLTLQEVNGFRSDHGAINILYKSLQKDRDAADISSIIRELHEVIAPAIAVTPESATEPSKLYDISKIDFDRLRQEFAKSTRNKQTDVQNLREAIEKRLAVMLSQNPLRTNFQQHFEEIVAGYNGEKDRVTIEASFEALMRLASELDVETHRALREGLDEESLAIFDLLTKPDLTIQEIDRIKTVAKSLLELLNAKKTEIDNWRAKEATRDDVKRAIADFLYDDRTGLPASYSDTEIMERSDKIFAQVFYTHGMVASGVSGSIVAL